MTPTAHAACYDQKYCDRKNGINKQKNFLVYFIYQFQIYENEKHCSQHIFLLLHKHRIDKNIPCEIKIYAHFIFPAAQLKILHLFSFPLMKNSRQKQEMSKIYRRSTLLWKFRVNVLIWIKEFWKCSTSTKMKIETLLFKRTPWKIELYHIKGLENIYSMVFCSETVTKTNTIKNLKLTLENGVSMKNFKF